MLWRLRHRLFGTDFVLYRDTSTHFVGKVEVLPNGNLMMKSRYGIWNAIMLPGGVFSKHGGSWEPLTWNEEEKK